MAINDIVQSIAEARVDARSLSEFVFKPEGFKVARRLAPPIDTLQFYINRFDATKATTDAYIATIPNIVNDAINNTAVEGGVLADTFVTATANGVGTVDRTQRSVNAETVSLLDFGAPYSTDSSTHLQAAFDYLGAQGGGVLHIPYHKGRLVLSGSHACPANVVVNCARNLIVDCTGLTSTHSFTATGSTGDEKLLGANITSGAKVITTTTAHGLVPCDDVLLVSQRGCAHADAGLDWRLGETTSSVSSPFFAEPIVVNKVQSPTVFNVQAPVIFPDYRTDKTLETMATARNSSTVMKLNMLSNFKWFGGIFKKETGSLFRFLWTKDCELDIEVQRGYGSGAEIENTYSLGNNFKIKVSRPNDWVLVEDHYRYNSVKDVSSWYTEIDLLENNGCQGLDQTYSLYSSLFPVYKVRHIGARQDAMTTHGCTYGANISIIAANCQQTVLRNRARFTTVNINAINCNSVIKNSAYGCLDGDFKVNAYNCFSEGVNFSSRGVSAITPARKNSKISGFIYMSPSSGGNAINLDANLDVDAKLVDSGINLVDLKIRSYGRAVFVGENVHGITIKDVDVKQHSDKGAIWFRRNAGHDVSGLTVDYVNGDGTNEALFASILLEDDANEYGVVSYNVDYASCKVIRGTLVGDSLNLVAHHLAFNGLAGATDKQTLGHKNIAPSIHIKLNSGSVGDNRLILDNSIPVGMVIQVYLTAIDTSYELGLYSTSVGSGVINFMDSVNDAGARYITAGTGKYFNIQKVGKDIFNIYK